MSFLLDHNLIGNKSLDKASNVISSGGGYKEKTIKLKRNKVWECSDWKGVHCYESDHLDGEYIHRFSKDIQLCSREIVCHKTLSSLFEIKRTEQSDKRKKTFNLTNETNNDSLFWRSKQTERSSTILVPDVMLPTPSLHQSLLLSISPWTTQWPMLS